MLRLRMLPGFRLADGDGHERPFDDFLADFNVILLTHTSESCRGATDELLRSFLAEGRGVAGVSIHGIDIRSHDAFCKQCCGPHVVFHGRELITICDSGAWIRRLWGVESDAWILIVNAGRHVLDDGPLTEIERLAMQFGLDAALSPHRSARAPPTREGTGRRDTAA
ncbi:MAG: hypothetical protein J5J06_16125 [Phycisphaerae bacterium]|nr:hypothetical protein [Phycisphaerae bacterium]